MSTPPPQLTVSRVFDAPRAMVFTAFTDPEQIATWWGPTGSSVLPDGIEFDVRPGGFQRWIEVASGEPDLRIHVSIDLGDVTDGHLLTGVLRVFGRLRDGIDPFETAFRIEFHDEPDGRCRLEIEQWLPAHLTGPTRHGWTEAFQKLDATLARLVAVTTAATE